MSKCKETMAAISVSFRNDTNKIWFVFLSTKWWQVFVLSMKCSASFSQNGKWEWCTEKVNIFYWNAYNIILASEFKAQTLITCIKRLEISPHRLPVFPLTLSQLPAARSNLSPESASAAAARSGGQNTKRVSVTNQISSIRIVFSWYASCSQRIYLIDGSLLLGGPSLLAVMQLLQIAL